MSAAPPDGVLLAFVAAILPLALAGAGGLEVDLALEPGALCLVDAETPEHERALVDGALGLVEPLAGRVVFRDHDWQRVPPHFRDALRGTCALIPRQGGLLPHADMSENILLSARYHRSDADPALVARGAALARRFGLPGLPAAAPATESVADRLRAACVRAFLGEPVLVIAESRAQGWRADLVAPLLDAMQAVRERGGAVLWTLVDDPLFDDATVPASARYRLRGRRLRVAP